MNRHAFSALALFPLVVAGCGASPAPAPAPKPLASAPPPSPKQAPITIDQQIDNLVAYTKLLGYVRYFHPSDEAASADWENLAVSSVPRVEQARSPEELAAALQSVFGAVAPTLRVYPSGRAPAVPAELSPPTGVAQPTYVAWVHHGLGAAFGASAGGGLYRSVRASNVRTPHGAVGDLLHEIDRKVVAGKKIHVTASVRAELADTHTVARLAIAGRGPDGRVVHGQSDPITSSDWHDVEVVGTVAESDAAVFVDLNLLGDGKAWIDDVRVTVDGASAPLPLDDAGFEAAKPDALPAGWDGDDGTADYRAFTSTVKPHGGTRCGELDAKPLPVEAIPKPAEVFRGPLGGGVEAMVPLALYLDANGRTIPASSLVPEPSSEPAEKRLARYSANDRMVRVADVALVWNVFEHFYPYFDAVKVDWPAELRTALARAIADADAKTFHTTLQRLVAATHDGHGGVWRDGTDADPRQPMAVLPLAWLPVEGKLVVTGVAKGAGDVHVGDVVVSIDGRPAAQVLADKEQVTSAPSAASLAVDAASHLRLGPRGESATLALSRAGAAPVETKVPYAADSNTVAARPTNGAEVAPGVFYVDLTAATHAENEPAVDRLVAKLAGARGVVFDLRGDPTVSNSFLSHLSGQVLHTPDWRVPRYVRPDREGVTLVPEGQWKLEPAAPRVRAKAAFLVDARTASHGETISGIVDAYKLGALVGSPTHGTNGNRNDVPLPGGFVVAFTGMVVPKHDGSPLFGVGYAPTVPCAPTVAGIAAGKDEVLACGVAAVK